MLCVILVYAFSLLCNNSIEMNIPQFIHSMNIFIEFRGGLRLFSAFCGAFWLYQECNYKHFFLFFLLNICECF